MCNLIAIIPTTVCGLTRTADWSLGLVRAGDCPACADQLRHDLTEEKDRARTLWTLAPKANLS